MVALFKLQTRAELAAALDIPLKKLTYLLYIKGTENCYSTFWVPKKSGGVTRSHLRISGEEILSSYYVDNPSFIVISKDSYIYKYDVLDNIKDSGTILLNINLDEETLVKTLPNKIKKIIANKNLSLFIITKISFCLLSTGIKPDVFIRFNSKVFVYSFFILFFSFSS